MTLQLLKKVTNVLTYILIFSDTSLFKNFSLWGGRNSTIWSHNDVTVPIMLCLDVGNDENIILCYFAQQKKTGLNRVKGPLKMSEKALYSFPQLQGSKITFSKQVSKKKSLLNVQFARPVFFWSWSLSAYIVPHKKWFFLDFDITGWSIGHELIISLNWII